MGEEGSNKIDPIDGSTADLTPSENSRVREATAWIEDNFQALVFWVSLHNVGAFVIRNWKAWGVGIAVLAFWRTPEFQDFLDFLTGVNR